jgi:3-oxoadipate enol-lactonase
MPFVEIGDFRAHYALSGPAGSPVLVLSNSLGTNFSMWDPQLTEFEKRLRVLRYDTRGHGQSSVTPGPYRIEQLGRDVLHLLDRLNIDRVHFCGLSLGGMTGMWLGVHAPERLLKLVLCNTAARIGTADLWNARIAAVRKGGMKSIAAAVIERWFTSAFRSAAPETVERTERMIEATTPEGYAACCAAVRDMDQRESISSITAPTLVICGAQDPATPPADGQFLAAKIRGARCVELPAAHLSNIEAAVQFSSEVIRFLAG